VSTIRDVAREAGVSNATVSRVLNGNYPVAPETRERVLAAVKALGYVANAHARALIVRSTGTIGVIVHDIADPYFAEILRGVQQVCDEHKRLLVTCNSMREPGREISYIEMLRSQKVDAVVLAGGYVEDDEFLLALDEEARRLRSVGARLVLCGDRVVRADAVTLDNANGANLITLELLRAGHTRIAHISGPTHFSTTRHRQAGYTAALESYGVTPDPSLVIPGDFTRDGGYAACVKLLESGLDCTAIFAGNDQTAIGALSALRDAGASVPADMSLVGFGDIPISRDLSPALTTVRIPLGEIGRAAAKLALSPEDGERVVRLATEVVIRDSVASRRKVLA
jgi:LacI family transcriptional regulator, galactose operon repressor